MRTVGRPRSAPLVVSTRPPTDVGGLRIPGLWTSRNVEFDTFCYKEFIQRRITVGRSRTCDIRIRNRTVSSHHGAIERQTRSTRDVYWFIDYGSRNGVFVDDPTNEDDHWQRRTIVRLKVGMRLLLGDVRVLVADRHGNFPMFLSRHSDFSRRALTAYGNPSAASRHTGIAVRALRRVRETMG